MLRIMPNIIDELDGRLLALLREDPRIGIAEAARRLGAARGTVQARLERLQSRGVVRGFGPEVDPVRLGYPILAFVFLEISQGRLQEAVDVLEHVPEVVEAHGVSGPRDLLVRIVARDTDHLQSVINEVLSTTAVRRSTSYISLSEQIATRTGPLVESAVTPSAR
jgi:DNA-binding Lrp family transcriptional regulator